MQDKTSNHTPIPTELNIAPRGKSWLHGQLIDGEHGYPTRQSMENAKRTAFEKWARFFGTWDVERDDDPNFSTTGYTDITVNVAWLAFQAGAALTATTKDRAADGEKMLVQRQNHLSNCNDEACLECSSLIPDEWVSKTPAAASVVPPEPDAVIKDVMGLVSDWGMASHCNGEAALDAHNPEATEDEIAYSAECQERERAAWLSIESKLRALLATATGLPAQAEDIADLVTGMSVSVDVSTGDDDAGNRYFGTVTLAQEDNEGKHGLTLLVQDAEPNFTPQAQADARDALTSAARDVLAERARQISAEGYDPAHDDEHSDGSLSVAAACYALANVSGARPGALSPSYLAAWVGWGAGWFKPSDRRRNLEKACALLLADMERIDRAAIAAAKGD